MNFGFEMAENSSSCKNDNFENDFKFVRDVCVTFQMLFNEIIKKCLFQGKEMDEDKIIHLRKELGDIMWYVAQACLALNTNIEEIIDINTAKLSDRYPGGFDSFRSENRKEGDI